MTSLLETPVFVILFGILAEAVLGIVLVRTGRGVLLWPMIGVLLLVLAGVALEWLVVTDRERVEAAIDDAAAALETNPKGESRRRMIDTYIAESDHASRALLGWALDRVQINRIKITNLEISINRLTSPPTAEAELTGYCAFKDRKGEYLREGQPIEFTLELREVEPGRWLVAGHTWHDDPR